jgi:ParB family chromosome partitioning protein
MSTTIQNRKRGLGRGLSALFEDDEGERIGVESASTPSTQDQSTTQIISRKILPIDQMAPDPTQPRTHFDPEALSMLADSIAQHGVLQPILIRSVAGEKQPYQIIAGERRWRASQLAGLHEIPVVIKDLDDKTAFELALIENLQREDLNHVEEARGYKRLMDDFDYTQDQVAKIIGKSRPHIANTLRLLLLPDAILELLVTQKISAGHARALIHVENAADIAAQIIEKGLSVRQVEHMVAADKPSSSLPKKSAKNSHNKEFSIEKTDDILALEHEVSMALGMKVDIELKGAPNQGALSIHFQSLDQLDDVLHRLSHYPGRIVTG